MAEGSQRYLAQAKETTPGTITTGTAVYTKIRNTGGSGIANDRTNITSSEIRDDRAITESRLGNNQPNLSIPIEFSYASYEDFMAAALGHSTTWAAVTYTNMASRTITAVAGSKFTTTTTNWYDDGVRVGDKITLSGVTGNTDAIVVTRLDDLDLYADNATIVAFTGTGSEGFAPTTDITKITCGIVDNAFSIEEGFTDLTIPQYQVVGGSYVSSFGLSIQPDAVVTGNFDFQGMVYDGLNTSSQDAGTIVVANTNNVFDTYTGVMYIEGLTETCIVTGLDFTLDNGLNRRYALMDKDACSVGQGRTNVTGTVNAYFNSATMTTLFNNETEFHMSVRLEDLDGNSYVIGFPVVKVTSDGKDVSENDVTQTLNFQALGTDTTDTTMYVRKQAAV